MATFKVRIEDMVGSVSDDDFLSDALTDEAASILDLLPEQKVRDFTKSTPVTTIGLTAPGERIVEVLNTPGYPAKEVSPNVGKLATDSNSLYFTSERDPVYYLDPSVRKYFIVSDGEKATGNFISIAYPTIAHGDTPGTLASGDKYPKDMEGLLVLGAAIRCMPRLMADGRGKLPGALSITATAPTVADAPSFTYTDAAATSVSAVTVGSLGTAPTYTKPTTSVSWTVFDTAIGNDDVEIAESHTRKENTRLSEYTADIQNELNEFNKELAVYQSTVQDAMKDADMAQQKAVVDAQQATSVDIQNRAKQLEQAITEYSATLQKFNSDLQRYGALVNTEVQDHVNTIQNFMANHNQLLAEWRALKEDYNGKLTLLLKRYDVLPSEKRN